MNYYKQCDLKKGNITQTSYIPEKFAVAGAVLKIKQNGQWDDGWVVESVHARVDEDFINGMRSLVKKFRWSHDLPQGTFRGE